MTGGYTGFAGHHTPAVVRLNRRVLPGSDLVQGGFTEQIRHQPGAYTFVIGIADRGSSKYFNIELGTQVFKVAQRTQVRVGCVMPLMW